MAVSTTLMNWREQCLPQLTTFAALGVEPPGNPEGGEFISTFSRQYTATIQILHEGDTSDVIRRLYETRFQLGQVYANWPLALRSIRVDDKNIFSPPTDLHPPDTVKNKLFVMPSEITGNYSKNEYGKASFIFSVEAFCPQEYFNVVTGEWQMVPIAEA
jgi:hypothetical protein